MTLKKPLPSTNSSSSTIPCSPPPQFFESPTHANPVSVKSISERPSCVCDLWPQRKARRPAGRLVLTLRECVFLWPCGSVCFEREPGEVCCGAKWKQGSSSSSSDIPESWHPLKPALCSALLCSAQTLYCTLVL